MSRPPPLVRPVEQALRRWGVAGGLVVAVSGGPDSVALLRALHEVRGGDGLTCAHLNHQLRAADSDADEAFVRELCGRLSLDCRCHRLDVRAAAGAGGANLEGTARRLRYDWLAEVARQAGAGWVATGHTADDQAETVLMRALTSATPRSLRAMAEREGAFARPLLRVWRSDVLAYCRALGLVTFDDPSNDDRRFLRSRVRHDVIPALERTFPGARRRLVRLAERQRNLFEAEGRLTGP